MMFGGHSSCVSVGLDAERASLRSAWYTIRIWTSCYTAARGGGARAERPPPVSPKTGGWSRGFASSAAPANSVPARTAFFAMLARPARAEPGPQGFRLGGAGPVPGRLGRRRRLSGTAPDALRLRCGACSSCGKRAALPPRARRFAHHPCDAPHVRSRGHARTRWPPNPRNHDMTSIRRRNHEHCADPVSPEAKPSA